MAKRSAPAEHEHSWANLPVPAEPLGRLYQCSECGTCGHRRARFGGAGKVVEIKCNVVEGCGRPAKLRLFGRGTRGAYRWACADHAVGRRAAGTTEATPQPVEKRPSTPPPG